MIDFIQKLISFDSTYKENDAMKFIQGYVEDIYGDKLHYEQQDIGDDWRYNLVIKNTDQPDIILAWHVDVVPAFSQEQFVPVIKDNRLYWRWAVDMKAWVAINIALIDFMIKNNIKFWVLCYADEEYNFLGMKKFIETYQWKIAPALTIVTEPTDTKIYTWFRGIASVDLKIRGKSVHSAIKYSWINAITEYVYFVDHLEKHLQSRDTYGYQSLVNLSWIDWWIDKWWTIVWQDNIVPNIANWNFSLRLWNIFSPEELTDFVNNYFGNKWIEILAMHIKVWCNPLIQVWLKEQYGKYWTVEEWYTFWYSDGQFIKEHIGWDCLLIWPGPNEKSHQIDEYVDIESISKAKEIIEKILLVNFVG